MRSTRLAAVTAAAAALTVTGVLGLGTAGAASNFHTLNDAADPTFNQLLGINDNGVIAGYFGSGADANHPNKGYTLNPPYGQGNYVNENYPGSVQTQVTAINNKGTTVGFYIDGHGHSFGFVDQHGQFTQVKGVTQLLGINNKGNAVGFSTDKHGATHAVRYNLASHQISKVKLSGNPAISAATGINDSGDIAGLYIVNGNTDGFLVMHGVMKTFSYGDNSNTQVFGVNNSDVVVGFFANGGDDHGFVTNSKNGHTQQVDDPNQGPASTVVNGLNNKGQIVGFYTDAAGNTDGFLANK
jgi:hypothetical protein